MSTELTEPTTESVQLSKTLAEMQSLDEHGTAEVSIPWRQRLYCHTHTALLFATQGCCQLADTAFKQSHFDVAFALVRAGESPACR